MIDVVDRKTRSRMMSGIKGGDTQPELLIRRELHHLGFRHRLGKRYRWKGKLMPGRPDLVFPKYMAVIQVNGCFWHLHDCHLFKWPSTQKEFWKDKLTKNAERDRKNQEILEQQGWRVFCVWECALKGRTRRPLSKVILKTANWLQYDTFSAEIAGCRESEI